MSSSHEKDRHDSSGYQQKRHGSRQNTDPKCPAFFGCIPPGSFGNFSWIFSFSALCHKNASILNFILPYLSKKIKYSLLLRHLSNEKSIFANYTVAEPFKEKLQNCSLISLHKLLTSPSQLSRIKKHHKKHTSAGSYRKK